MPTSAVTGEGVNDLIFLILQLSQKFLKDKLKPKDKLECNVLEIRAAEGFGAAASLIIVNGQINLGDTVVMCGLNGPVITRVRALFLPGQLKEIRDTSNKESSMTQLKVARGVCGVKLFARGLEQVVAGSPVYVAKSKAELDVLKSVVMEDLDALTKRISKSTSGVTGS